MARLTQTWCAFALSILVSWLPNSEADLDHYELVWSERHVIAWVDCPDAAPGSADCPIYNPFIWHVLNTTQLSVTLECANRPYDFCVLLGLKAVDRAGNKSPAVGFYD